MGAARCLVHYDNGQKGEVSWSFIRELPPKDEAPCERARVGFALTLRGSSPELHFVWLFRLREGAARNRRTNHLQP